MRLADAPEQSFTTTAIANEFRIPYNHLTKVVQDLARGRFITTQRGAGGGLRLARDPEDIHLGEVVRYLEQRHSIAECFRADGGQCVLTPQCRLKPQLKAAREAFLAELDKTSIAECAYPPRPAPANPAGAPMVAPGAAHATPLPGKGAGRPANPA